MKNLGEQILSLREKGYSYRQIEKELGCARSTISYWCGTGQKDKTKDRTLKIEDWILHLSKRITGFKSRIKSNRIRNKVDWKRKIKDAVCDFCKRTNMKSWGYKQLIDKYGTKVKCYLTGRDIDITTDDYHLDHIVPISKGGSSNIDNVGFTIPAANKSKADMTLEEYLDLCEEVLRYHGRIK